MTIKIEVKNLETRSTAILAVAVEANNVALRSRENLRPPTELKAGEVREFYVHASQHLRIWEVQ